MTPKPAARAKAPKLATTVEKAKTPAKSARTATPAKKANQRSPGAPPLRTGTFSANGDTYSQERSDDTGEEEDSEAELQVARMADSVALAVEARLTAKLQQPLRNSATAADLVPPPWPGKLNLKSDTSKLTLWLAARTRYVEVCRLSEHAPVPLHCPGTFSPEEVPTLRRWLNMVEGTCLCDDWVTLSPTLEAAIIPTLKARMESLSEETLHAELTALRIPHFASSWADLASAFDQYTAKWTVAVFRHKRAAVELHTADLADIMKAHCIAVESLRHLLASRCDDVAILKARVFAFLEQEEKLSVRPGAAVSQRPPSDSRKGGASVAFASTPPSHKTTWSSPSAPPGNSLPRSTPSPSALRSAGIAKVSISPAPASKKQVSLNAVGAAVPTTPRAAAGCNNCGLPPGTVSLNALFTWSFPFPSTARALMDPGGLESAPSSGRRFHPTSRSAWCSEPELSSQPRTLAKQPRLLASWPRACRLALQ